MFGVWLKQRRKALDLTREQLARRVHCSVSTLRRLEGGDLRASKELAHALAAALDVPDEQRDAFVAYARGDSTKAPVLAQRALNASGAASVVVRRPSVVLALPAPLTRLVGRKREMGAITELLRADGVRLLTLTGAPGAGKTRLAIAVARELIPAFPDGIFFVPLAAITDSSRVVASIARLLGLQETSDLSLADTLINFLREKKLLLVLDNFEQVLSAAPQIAEWLTAAPNVKALVTSRETLNVYGEHEYPVPPLEHPNMQPSSPTRAAAPPHALKTSVARYPAIQLFQERARAVKPDFRLTVENALDVARICASLDGLPLAIEMAAAQTKWFMPAQLFAQLRHRLEMLNAGPRDLTPRQQTLRGAIEWSYDLLSETERRVFDALGVFVGGCAVDAVAFVIQEKDVAHVRELLRLLVNKNLLRLELGAAAERFEMLQVVAEYAREKLERRGARDKVARRHAEFFLALAREASDALRRAEQQIVWLDTLEREYANVRAALEWFAAQQERADSFADLTRALEDFWRVRGYFGEGRLWSERAAQRAADDTARAALLVLAADFAARQGDYAAAQRFAEEALEIFTQTQGNAGSARVLATLGTLAGRRGDFARAEEMLQRAAALERAHGAPLRLALTLNNLGIALQRRKKWREARAVFEECLALRRALGDETGVANALNGLAGIYWELGDGSRALETLRGSLELKQKVGDRAGLASGLANAAAMLWAWREARRAAQLYGASARLGSQVGLALPPYTRREREQEIAQIRAQLGDEAFHAAWDQGQTESVEKIVGELLDAHSTT